MGLAHGPGPGWLKRRGPVCDVVNIGVLVSQKHVVNVGVLGSQKYLVNVGVLGSQIYLVNVGVQFPIVTSISVPALYLF